MSTRTWSLSILVGLGTVTWLYRPVRFVRTQTLGSSVYWTVRSWLWNYPITPDFSQWKEGNPIEMEKWMIERKRIIRMWNFLKPFFAMQGYNLYVEKDPSPTCGCLIPPANSSRSNKEVKYPYAQYACASDEELAFDFTSPFVRPARGKDGREVVIKAISGPTPSKELKAFQMLHSDSLCNDPRNHTIPILEYIEFNQQIFAVMPRWSIVYRSDFVTVGELIRFGQAFFEAVAFLHQNKITHGDILNQNMLMDVLIPWGLAKCFAGFHAPDRRYVLIDFETAELPNVDGSHSPKFEWSMKRDVQFLAYSLQVKLRCIEHVIPQIGDLFDSMTQSDSPDQPTAATALARFEDICRNLTAEDLNLPVDGIEWYMNGDESVTRSRDGPPVYRQL